MAWNPSPEVQVVRDAAAALSKLMSIKVDRCIILFTSEDGGCGYVSYGETAKKCANAKRMAKAAAASAWEEAA